MSFGPQSNMTRTQPASPGMGGQGGGNMGWLLPLLQAMQQSRMQRPAMQQGANRFLQGGLFGNNAQIPAPQMPAPSLFQPVQQAPRVPFAPYTPPPAAPAAPAAPASNPFVYDGSPNWSLPWSGSDGL